MFNISQIGHTHTHNTYKENIESTHQRYRTNPNSKILLNCLSNTSNASIRSLLLAIKHNPKLRQKSMRLSKRSALFNKLVLIKGNGDNSWALRLHIYPVTDQRIGLRDNLGNLTHDPESSTHYHRWDLASHFICGGFINHDYEISTYGDSQAQQYTEYAVAATSSGQNSTRQVRAQGIKYIRETNRALYLAGSMHHYPIRTPHSVSGSISPFTGTTMTLAITSEAHTTDSRFFKKNGDLTTIEQMSYDDAAFDQAINEAVARLHLVDIADELALMGYKRFAHLNAVDTELLPTIAMLHLQMTFSRPDEQRMMQILQQKIKRVDQHVLQEMAKQSQEKLIQRGYFVANANQLPHPQFVDTLNRAQTTPSAMNKYYTQINNKLTAGCIALLSICTLFQSNYKTIFTGQLLLLTGHLLLNSNFPSSTDNDMANIKFSTLCF